MFVRNRMDLPAGFCKITVCMKLAATFGNLTGNVRGDQQGWLAVAFALGVDQRRGFGPVYALTSARKRCLRWFVTNLKMASAARF